MEYTLHKTWDGLIITSDEIVEKGDKSLLITEELTLVLTHFEDCEDDYAGEKVIAQQNQIDLSALSEEEQSLSQQKSWKVELEMKEEVLYTEDGLDYKGGLIPKLTKGKVKITKILGNNE